MKSDSLARNHFQAVVRDSRGLLFYKKIQRYRFEISLVKYDHDTIINASRSTFREHIRGLYFLNVSKIFNDTGLRYRAFSLITIPYIMPVGGHFKSAVGGVRKSRPFTFSGCSEV